MPNSQPFLSGISASVTFDEEAVNLAPQLIDSSVAFSDADNNFDGGSLVLSGGLAHDILAIRHQGIGAGEIGLIGADVFYGNVWIGTFSGGSGGSPLSVAFNEGATSAAVDALIENLTYRNLSDTPAVSRTLELTITDAAGAVARAPLAMQANTGGANPLDGIDAGYLSAPNLADLDGDGDLDAVVGQAAGSLNYYENTGSAVAPAFVGRTGAANPFNGIDVGNASKPALGDLDGDGDLDAVIGGTSGLLSYYRNTGSAAAPAYLAQTGAANPFDGFDVGGYSTPALADLDGDGDLDAVVGEILGTLKYFRNTGSALAPAYAEQTGAANPFNGVAFGAHVTPTFADLDGDGDRDAVIGNDQGDLKYLENAGTALAPSFVGQTGAANPFNAVAVDGYTTAPDLADLDGDGDFDAVVGGNYGTLQYFENVTPEADFELLLVVTPHADPSSGPDVMNGTGGDDTLDGGAGDDTLDGGAGSDTASYLSASSGVSVSLALQGGAQNTGGAGSDSLTGFENLGGSAFNDMLTGDAGANALDGGAGVDTMSGSAGDDTFFVDEAGDTVDELAGGGNDTVKSKASAFTLAAEVENLVLLETAPAFAERTDAANPFNGLEVASSSAPTLADLDGDDDLDAVVGQFHGFLAYYKNTGSALAPAYAEQTGSANPFNGFDVGYESTPRLADLDGDGDLDAVVGEESGTLNYYRNTGTALAPAYAEQTGGANPFSGIDVGLRSAPSLGDLDGDGDVDAVLGDVYGSLRYYRNTGTAVAPAYAEQTGAANPFDGLVVTSESKPTLADFDGDGDLDAAVGAFSGVLAYFENAGTAASPVYVARTGVANPFDGIDVGERSASAVADLDGDGIVDAVIGKLTGELNYYRNAGGPNGTGNGLANTITGNDLDNVLDGGAGIDAMSGGLGHDTYIVDENADAVTELSGAGTDAVHSTAPGYTLGSFIENLLLLGGANINGTGNSLANVITGNSGNNTIEGGAGDDSLIGGAGSDTASYASASSGVAVSLAMSAGQNTLGAGNDTLSGFENLTGSAFNDTLTGNAGANVLAGGAGNDTFQVESAADAVVEGAGGGIDLVIAAADFTLGAEVENLVLLETAGFVERTGAANPLNGIDVGSGSAPSFADLDGDGDLDALVGETYGTIKYYKNTGTALAPAYAEQTGGANPLGGVDYGNYRTPSLADLDGDGDFDVVVGETYGALTYYKNTGTALAPAYAEQGGAANPFNGIDVGHFSAPTLADLDGDGDIDAVVSELLGTLKYYRNTGTALAPAFAEQSGSANPFNGIDVGFHGRPDLADLDGDGDLDAVIGEAYNSIKYYENTGTVLAPVYLERTGSDNPFGGFDIGDIPTPTLADLDGDGDLDAVVGEGDEGVINYYENLVVTRGTGNGLANTITGSNGANVLAGLDGSDTIDGGGGNDELDGGADSDTVSYASALAGVTVSLALQGGAQNTASAGNDKLVGFENLAGSAFDDTLTGNSSNNTLDGGAGNDSLNGGTGIDAASYASATSGVAVSLGLQNAFQNTVGAGSDKLVGFENLVGSAFNDTLTGNGAVNTLTGGAGNDSLNGGVGADVLIGGAGDDTYTVNQADDVVTEVMGEGSADTVRSAATGGFTLPAFVEKLVLLGALNINGTGNELDNTIDGNAGENILSGGEGNDTLDGKAGKDELIGGLGDDVYVVNQADDVVTETVGAGGGIDTVKSSAPTFQLGARLENLQLLGAADIDGTGNGLANSLTGNSGNNALNGGTGADAMIGGAGDDTYTVDVAGDVVTELAGQGTDTVRSTLTSYTLPDFVENLLLLGIGNIGATGNDAANRMTGNSGANALSGAGGNDIIDGRAGADIMHGGAGDDTFLVDDTGDEANEAPGEGTDTVKSSAPSYTLDDDIEILTLLGTGDFEGTGNGAANTLNGNGGKNLLSGAGGIDRLFGKDGDDTLDGGSGRDTLNGGTGADVFRFSSGDNDVVADFAPGVDKIALDHLFFAQLGVAGALDPTRFHSAPDAVQGLDANDYLVYNQTNGVLYYDANGAGGAIGVRIATLVGSPDTLSASDFVIV